MKKELALKKHREWKGKLEIVTRSPVENKEDLAIAYTPGVAEPCLEIQADESLAYDYTGKGNLVAVISDGTAVLGLGDIGPSASMPVLEGKCALFKKFADINAIPICIDSKEVDEIVSAITLISKSFGGINLEDISAPRCFEIEKRLVETLDIPVFHDDQHGTAIVTAAALINAVKLVKKDPSTIRIVISGAGAAGISIARLLINMGFGDILLCSSKGAIYEGAPDNNSEKEEIAKITNRSQRRGSLEDVIKGADVLIGVSMPQIVSEEMVASMADKPIVFGLANPIPEIMPEAAKRAGAAIVATGRSDYPNQVNNVLAFPGIFKGALLARAPGITEEMKVVAARAIAQVVSEKELSPDYILPDAFNEEVVKSVSRAIIKEAERNKA